MSTQHSKRQFLKNLGLFGLSLPLFCSQKSWAFRPYDGPLFVSFAADGGWDTASFCDPKYAPVNQWVNNNAFQAGNDAMALAGNIPYASFGNNALLFENHFAKMLVVNGIDTQSSTLKAGRRHTWTGRIESGHPTFSALYAGVNGAQLPLSYLTNGGFKETAGIIHSAFINSTSTLLNFSEAQSINNNNKILPATTLSRVRSMHLSRRQRLYAQQSLAPRLRKAIQDLVSASAGLQNLETLPPALELAFPDENSYTQHPQIRIALACMSAGLTASADLFYENFDTHMNNDVGQHALLGTFNTAIDFFWTLAEQLNLSDRLRVYLSSDAARAPIYNDEQGKNRWPITSSIFMQNNITWGNRVVGQTGFTTQKPFGLDGNLNAIDGGGTLLKPRHLHHVLRNWLQIPPRHPLALKYKLFKEDEADFLDLSRLLELSPRGLMN